MTTSTAVAVAEPLALPLPSKMDMGGGLLGRMQALVEWANAAKAVHAMSEAICQTPFVPDAYRGKPYSCTAAILAGAEVGLDPMSSLAAFDVIGGKATPRAVTMRAILLNHGFKFRVVEWTAEVCTLAGIRPGDDPVEVTWDIPRAAALKLAGKDNWKEQPKAMLMARCTSELSRLIGADVLLGMAYSSEEFQDDPDLDRRTVTTATVGAPLSATDILAGAVPVESPPKAAAARATAGGPAPSASASAAADTKATPSPDDKPTVPMTRRMFGLMNGVGIKTREAQLEYVRTATGRDLSSTSELTMAEARDIIQLLSALPEGTTVKPAQPTEG